VRGGGVADLDETKLGCEPDLEEDALDERTRALVIRAAIEVEDVDRRR
jgi:hypothetical protein